MVLQLLSVRGMILLFSDWWVIWPRCSNQHTNRKQTLYSFFFSFQTKSFLLLVAYFSIWLETNIALSPKQKRFCSVWGQTIMDNFLMSIFGFFLCSLHIFIVLLLICYLISFVWSQWNNKTSAILILYCFCYFYWNHSYSQSHNFPLGLKTSASSIQRRSDYVFF